MLNPNKQKRFPKEATHHLFRRNEYKSLEFMKAMSASLSIS